MKFLKYIILVGMFGIVSCTKDIIEPVKPPVEEVEDIFLLKEKNVTNGEKLKFVLKMDGFYTLTLTDSESKQVLMRERVFGKFGINSFDLFTKSLPTKYLYLSLEDAGNLQLGKTLLIIN